MVIKICSSGKLNIDKHERILRDLFNFWIFCQFFKIENFYDENFYFSLNFINFQFKL